MTQENADSFLTRQHKTIRDTKTQFADRIPHMQITFRDRLHQLIEKADISVAEAERRSALANGTLRKLFANPDQDPSVKTLEAIAKGFNVSVSYLVDGEITNGHAAPQPDTAESYTAPPIDARDHGPGSSPPAPRRHDMPNDVPVMGTAAGNHLRGAFKLGAEIVDYVRRPPALMRNKDVYALYVEGSSMEPQYFSGDLIFVNPSRPARVGDIVVVQISDEEGTSEGTLGIYRKRTETTVTIGKRNPVADVEIRRTSGIIIHKVLSNNELFGI